MTGMLDHQLHALLAAERVESLQATMRASRRRKQRAQERDPEAGRQPRLGTTRATRARPAAL